jgi:small subunit ribosomal protein S6
MRRYESIYVLRPDLSDEDLDTVRQKFTDIITNNGGHLILEDRWGSRTLAYEVKKQTRGYYVLLDYAADKNVVAELERNFKLHESVIRFLTVVTDRAITLEKLEALSRSRQAPPEPLAQKEPEIEQEPAEGNIPPETGQEGKQEGEAISSLQDLPEGEGQ